MKRARLNVIVDATAFVMLLLSIFTSIIPWLVLPSGGGGPRGGQEAAHTLFLGLDRGVWRDWHVYTSFALVGLVVVHLLLHWRWIRCIPGLFTRSRPELCKSDPACESGDLPKQEAGGNGHTDVENEE